MQIIDGVYLFGPGEALQKYNMMTPNFRGDLRSAIAGHNVKCSICMCDLTIAAFGPNVEVGGSYVRHPYLRAKTQHTAGFSCYDNRPNSNSPINMNNLQERESLINAMARLRRNLATPGEEGMVEVLATPTSPSRTPNGAAEGVSRTVRNVVRLPLDWTRIRPNKKYSYAGEFRVDVRSTSETGYRNIYLRSIRHGGNKFNIKLKVGMPIRDLILNDLDTYNNTIVTIITAFYMDNGIHDTYVTYWPQNLNNIEIELL